MLVLAGHIGNCLTDLLHNHAPLPIPEIHGFRDLLAFNLEAGGDVLNGRAVIQCNSQPVTGASVSSFSLALTKFMGQVTPERSNS